MNRLVFLRKQKNLTQKELAEALGTSPVYYSQIETGAKDLSKKFAVKLADYYNISVDSLLTPVTNDDVLNLMKNEEFNEGLPVEFVNEILNSPADHLRQAYNFLCHLNQREDNHA